MVVLVDGLGAACLRARSGHARTLSAKSVGRQHAALRLPDHHRRRVGHPDDGGDSRDPRAGRVHGARQRRRPGREPAHRLGRRGRPGTAGNASRTVFETAAADGVSSFAIGAERFRDSGFTQAVLRGAQYRAGETIADRFAKARAVLDSTAGALVYLYVPELDQAAHALGWESAKWLRKLEEVDAAVTELAAGLRRTEGLLVTADHGMLDVPARSHILFDSEPELVDGIRFVAGDPRCLQLHFEPDASAATPRTRPGAVAGRGGRTGVDRLPCRGDRRGLVRRRGASRRGAADR